MHTFFENIKNYGFRRVRPGITMDEANDTSSCATLFCMTEMGRAKIFSF